MYDRDINSFLLCRVYRLPHLPSLAWAGMAKVTVTTTTVCVRSHIVEICPGPMTNNYGSVLGGWVQSPHDNR